ncbi:MAG: GGDEF domain-containing protein, partial [Oscillospiraceae bacterium]|nr:GGDEF domain-containing protein [Oscillospiraceae bacterium]
NIYSGLPASYEARMRAGGSSYRWCRIDATPVLQDGVPVRVIGVITDIDKLKQETFALEKAVMLDSFTGLYNKKRFIELSERILTEHQDQSHALLLLDIDNFKQINDTLGHQVGDQVLRLVSEMLREAFQERDIVGRFGGDEFVVLCRNLTNWEWLVQKLEAILCCGEVRGIVCTNSVGIALFPGDAANFYQLLENADVALYQSKQRKRAYTFYTKE